MADSAFTITPCTDKAWRDECPYQIDVEGYDGNGWTSVAVPMTEDELDDLIALLQKYREQHP